MFSVRRTQGASFLALSEDGLRYQAITLVTFRLQVMGGPSKTLGTL